MANEQNLIPLSERPKSEQREIQSSGGVASGAARRRKRDMRQAADIIMAMQVSDKKIADAMRKAGFAEDEIDWQNANIFGLIKSGAEGNVKAVALLYSILGDNQQEEKTGITNEDMEKVNSFIREAISHDTK